MTIMSFGSNGWYNARPDFATRPYRADAPLYTGSRAARFEYSTADTFVLVDMARAGDAQAQVELRARDKAARA